MPIYVKRQKEIEAFQWAGSSQAEADAFTTTNGFPRFRYDTFKGKLGLIIEEGGNKVVAIRGDYVVKHPDGSHYRIKMAAFERKFQLKEA